MKEMGHSQMTSAGAILIAVGVLSFLVGFAGCCGAMKDSKLLLGVYIFFLTIVLIIEVAVGIFVLVEQKNIRGFVFKTFSNIGPVKKGSHDGDALNSLQKMFKCCGFTKGCSDWSKGEAYGCSCGKANGKDCVVDKSKKCKNMDHPGKAIYKESCYKKSVDYMDSHMAAVGGSVIGIALAEVFGLMIAILLCRNLKDAGYEAY